MELLLSFLIAFGFSFMGTIPPGTINLTIIQLGLDNKTSVAWRFAFGAAIVEYPYAWLAIEFESLITSSPAITDNFELISAVVMTSLGILTLWSLNRTNQSTVARKFQQSGFRRGFILGVLNPLALPFWVAMTAYIKSQGWIDLSSNLEVHAYLLGVSLGGFSLLMIFAFLARQVVAYFQQNALIRKIPGITLLVLGVYAMIKYFL